MSCDRDPLLAIKRKFSDIAPQIVRALEGLGFQEIEVLDESCTITAKGKGCELTINFMGRSDEYNRERRGWPLSARIKIGEEGSFQPIENIAMAKFVYELNSDKILAAFLKEASSADEWRKVFNTVKTIIESIFNQDSDKLNQARKLVDTSRRTYMDEWRKYFELIEDVIKWLRRADDMEDTNRLALIEHGASLFDIVEGIVSERFSDKRSS